MTFFAWFDLAGSPLSPNSLDRIDAGFPEGSDATRTDQRFCWGASAGWVRDLQFFPQPDMAAAWWQRYPIVLLGGRLNHRGRLAARLGLRPEAHDDVSLIRAAYLRWDSAWTEHIDGSVAAVVIDTDRQRVVASRDEMAREPLYWFHGGSTLLLASEPAILLRHPAVSRAHDRNWLSAWFSLRSGGAEPERTPFDAIRLLRPHERLIWEHDQGLRFETGRFRLGRQRLRFPRDEDYADGFRERLSAAIVDRTRGIDSMGILLSGGMDSCPVGCLAADHFRSTGQSLTAYSWTLDQFPEANETRELSECADFAGIPAVLLPADELLPFADPLDWPMDLNSPTANAYWPLFRAIYRRASADGCRVLLQGTFGDRMYPWHWELADSLSDGHVLLAAREIGALIERVGWQGLLKAPALRNCGKRFLRWRGRVTSNTPDWLTPAAAARLGGGVAPPPVDHARPDQYQALLGPSVFERSIGHRVDATEHGVYRLDPFHDADLIDYMLAIPAYQARRMTQTKFLARNAMRGRMPESLRLRPRGSLLSSFYDAGYRAARGRIREFLSRPDCTWTDYVRREVVLQALEQPSPPDRLKMLAVRALTYEVWNRRLEQLPGR